MRRVMAFWRSGRTGIGPVERPLRLATGLVLFAYATSHLLNHAFGVRSIEAMNAAGLVLLKPWQTPAGLTVLYASFIIHAGLGFHALYRRRHLRIPASEIWQLALGLAIPLLLIEHAGAIRLGTSLAGVNYDFHRVLYHYWVTAPQVALPRQYLLLLVVWIHGCIGIRAWLRPKSWYPRASPVLAAFATVIPTLALVGFTTAGLDIRDALQRDPSYAARYGPPQPGTPAAQNAASVGAIIDGLWYLYLGLLVAAFGLRGLRDWHAKRFRSVRLSYPGGRVVSVPAGFTVLEASRWGGIPHASVCGGRGRCSTCRVQVIEGGSSLAAPSSVEQVTLGRIAAPPDVRLACQIRPRSDLAVVPLVRPADGVLASATRFDAAIEGGRELEVVALFVDMRESTRLATGRLPYDALFLFDRYIQVATAAIRDNGGHVASIAGDGVMSLFGGDGRTADASAAAFKAAVQLWEGLDALNDALGDELRAPLRFGIGLHAGTAVVGTISSGGAGGLQFLGDTGNVAAKLEAETKRLNCTLVASLAAIEPIASAHTGLETVEVVIAGKQEAMRVATFRSRNDLRQFLLTASSQ